VSSTHTLLHKRRARLVLGSVTVRGSTRVLTIVVYDQTLGKLSLAVSPG